MKKFKKILTAAIAAAITLTATGAVASAKLITNSDAKAQFYYHYGSAQMQNLDHETRFVSARVGIVNIYTNVTVESDTKFDSVGYMGSKTAEVSGSKCLPFKSECSGLIRSGASDHSPIDWNPKIDVTDYNL